MDKKSTEMENAVKDIKTAVERFEKMKKDKKLSVDLLFDMFFDEDLLSKCDRINREYEKVYNQ